MLKIPAGEIICERILSRCKDCIKISQKQAEETSARSGQPRDVGGKSGRPGLGQDGATQHDRRSRGQTASHKHEGSARSAVCECEEAEGMLWLEFRMKGAEAGRRKRA